MQDYGPDDMFVYLEGECIEQKIDKYTYKVCPFGSASQNEGAASTSLGTYHGLQDDNTVMRFENVRIQSCLQNQLQCLIYITESFA